MKKCINCGFENNGNNLNCEECNVLNENAKISLQREKSNISQNNIENSKALFARSGGFYSLISNIILTIFWVVTFLICFDGYLCGLEHATSYGGECQIQGWILMLWILISAIPCLISLIPAITSLEKYNNVKKEIVKIGKFRKFNHYMTIILLIITLILILTPIIYNCFLEFLG